ncbi:MAG: cation:proton antiporter, partial [Candidatus Methanomethylophilaceae archaeon]|nr:cation:proton antiporter [Candidatus Methanomethylophilaceae archaeon]
MLISRPEAVFLDEITLMTSLAVFLLLAAVCSIVFNKIKMPSLIGYLVTGIIVANVWNVSEDGEAVVEILSNMGLIMLMFCIGMEINLKKLRKQGVFAMRVALVEIPFMVMGDTIVGTLLGLSSIQSICLGAVVAGSSTAVVLGVLKMQNRLEKDRIDTLILVIIMEDIAQVIILSMITPLMAGSELDGGGLAALIMSILVFMVVSVFVGLKFMPRIINWVSDNVTSEVLVIFAIGLTFGMALLASYVGLSVAIGAFLMGMMIAPSRKNKEILHDIEPMKNVFMAMFFISVGMEIGIETLIDNIGLTLVFLIMFITLKTMAVFSGYWLANENARDSFSSAVSFLAMGEFAFIIAKQALDYNVFDNGIYTSIVGAALLSMITLPLISKNAAERWDLVASKMPGKMLRSMKALDNIKISFYARIALASRRTRKEISGSMNRSYLGLIAIVVVELVFTLIAPPLKAWGMQYFGGNDWMWSFMILSINLVV